MGHARLGCQDVDVHNSWFSRAVVVALLVELSLPTPEIRGSNPDIAQNLKVLN